MTMSKVQEFRQLEQSLADNQKLLAELKPQVQDRLDTVELWKLEAEEKGYDLEEMALALCPHLVNPEKLVVASAPQRQRQQGKPRKARVVKTYKNPHNGEEVQTKGGNHKVLKEWKAKWGGAVVETWVSTNN
ncbi:hypothetical protein ALP54_03459 [Pseudomonas amygdali pv. lachrymans]|nr:histone-like nucleoid-structuring protein, MvaT/MvaU family [Pseudomonas amygdali]RMT06062.1 hypothetical protein ALP54_03459 [Pseudomonas amygdali pv. lachrymans]